MLNIDIFFNTIDKLLIEKGISKSLFYKEVGISSGNFSDWKKGRSKPSAMALSKISTYFNCSINELMTSNNNILSEQEERLIKSFKKLNSIGQAKANEQLEALTKIPEYNLLGRTDNSTSHTFDS